MAKFVTSKIFINGEDFLPEAGYHVKIHQKMAAHHSFSISFPYESTETQGGLLDSSIAYIGKKVSIGIGEGALEFKGLITNASVNKDEGSDGEIILSGYSPTILLEQTIQTRSYDEGSTLDQVVYTTLEEYASDLIQINAGAQTSLKLPYTVQYEENDFAFLKRMSSRYGIWFYYDGNDVCIGSIGHTTVEGTYGIDISTFSLDTQLQPQQFEMQSLDWHHNELYETDANAFSSKVSNVFYDTLKDESDTVYRKKSVRHWIQNQDEFLVQQGLDDTAKVEVLGKAANMILASGTSELPEIQVGGVLTVEGIQTHDHSKRDAYGSYIITEVKHNFNHAGYYENNWNGIPDGLDLPPYSNVQAYPEAGAQRAVVKENVDPDKLGRVKVQFPWQEVYNQTTPWIKINTPYAGSGKGLQFIPEIGEEVLIGFEGHNVERPFVLSAGFNAKAKSELDAKDNNIKAIITRSGHTIKFDDTDGSEKISIHDNEGSAIIFDTAKKSLQISATEELELIAKNITITTEEDITLQAKGDILTATEGNHTVQVKGDNTLQVDGDNTQSAGGAIALDATGDVTLNGKNIMAEGKSNATLKGTQTKIEGKITAVQGAGGKIDVN